MEITLCLTALIFSASRDVQVWTFDSPAEAEAWRPNTHLTDVAVRNGALHARAIEWDPFFTCERLEIKTTPWQYVVIRMKASRSGQGDLFWAGALDGPHGGLSEEKKVRFQVAGDDEWHDIFLFPFWHLEGVIRKLRLDVYDGAEFAIDSISVRCWADADTPELAATAWDAGDISAWRVENSGYYWAPPLKLDTKDLAWASLTIEADHAGAGALLWGAENTRGLHSEDFAFAASSDLKIYNIELQGIPEWKNVLAFGLRLPSAGVRVERLELRAQPAGPPDLHVTYFGFEDAINRAGKPRRVVAQITNRGGEPAQSIQAQIDAPPAFQLTPVTADAASLSFSDIAVLSWIVTAPEAGVYPARLALTGAGASRECRTSLRIDPPLELPKAEYVPEPRPVQTRIEIAAYYFPGWDSPAKWDSIRRVAPERKPVLGWYDEGNPECVDWQIKWAVENGISVFLVDWYWIQGNQHLTHWFEAYRKARYRDFLKVAIMWANHNPPGTHSENDWAKVSQRWIADYFTLPSYYRIDGRPAVFIWDHNNIRADLGSSDAVRRAFDTSQEAARKAGFDGIYYAALHAPSSLAQSKTLEAEGYHGATTYHEWGDAPGLADDPKRMRYEHVVSTAPQSWRRQYAERGGLDFFPVVDTGWDARPWHGGRAQVILGRTPVLFEKLLIEARNFCGETGTKLLILGPVNEWGEGSYIEPCAEYAFDMLEAVRRVFGAGEPDSWPVNIAPHDVGLGPYDFFDVPLQARWTFDNSAAGWSPMMGLSPLRVESGALRAETTSRDPAFMVDVRDLPAADYGALRVRMQVMGNLSASTSAQLFWSRGGEAMTETTSVSFPLAADGAMREYTVPLTSHPRWRGVISALRFDPCDAQGVTVVIDEFELTP